MMEYGGQVIIIFTESTYIRIIYLMLLVVHLHIDDAAAIDGIFMATCTDIYWREDLFDNWHFYDISQTYEFRKHGLRTVFLNDTDITLLHELSTKPSPVDYYEKYRQIFLNNYDIRQ